jgi:hypothetical protein
MQDGFEWDAQKAETNKRKHSVSFSDAIGVFNDPEAIGMEEEVVDGEIREVILGVDDLARILVVVYNHRAEKMRRISARMATKKEAKEYERRIRL